MAQSNTAADRCTATTLTTTTIHPTNSSMKPDTMPSVKAAVKGKDNNQEEAPSSNSSSVPSFSGSIHDTSTTNGYNDIKKKNHNQQHLNGGDSRSGIAHPPAALCFSPAAAAMMGNFHFPFSAAHHSNIAKATPGSTSSIAAKKQVKAARRKQRNSNNTSTKRAHNPGNTQVEPPKRKIKEEKMTLKAISEWAGDNERLKQLFYRAFFVGTQLAQSEAPGSWVDNVQSPNKIMRYMQEVKSKECMGEVRAMLRNLEKVPAATAVIRVGDDVGSGCGDDSNPVPMFTTSLSLHNQELGQEQERKGGVPDDVTSANGMNNTTISESQPSPFQTQKEIKVEARTSPLSETSDESSFHTDATTLEEYRTLSTPQKVVQDWKALDGDSFDISPLPLWANHGTLFLDQRSDLLFDTLGTFHTDALEL